jgi:TolB-like protein
MLAASREGLGFHSDETGLLPPPPYAGVRNGLVDRAVTGKTLVASEAKNKGSISEEAIRDEVSRILESSMFIQSERLGRFLRFTVETTLAGEAGSLKEYLIGTEVYERKPSYHPGEDSIVRSEARRLRRKLKEYYESDGKDDLVFIYYRPGSYVPAFRDQHTHSINITAAPDERVIIGNGIRIAVLPFLDASGGTSSSVFAQLITDELIHELVRTNGVRVRAASSVAPLVAKAIDMRSLARKLDVQIIFEGTVRQENNLLRITCRVVNAADGFQIWSERVETEPDLQGLSKVSERIASSLIGRILESNGRLGRLRQTPSNHRDSQLSQCVSESNKA